MNNFEGETADQIWQQVAKEVLAQETGMQNSRLGGTKELLHASFHIKDPRERWIHSRKPSINPAFAIAEVVWILAGRNDANFINHWNPGLPEFAGKSDKYHGAYGYRIRKQFGLDQLQRAYDILKNNMDSRQVILQIWDPRVDLPDSNGKPVSPDIPCNICSMPKIRNGCLEWLQIMRSNDVYRGMPYNIIQFTTIQEVLAGWLEVDVGGYHQISDSLHVYERDMLELKISDSKESKRNTDSLALTKKEFDIVIDELSNIFDILIKKNITERNFLLTCDRANIPSSYRNLLIVAAVDSARRRGWNDCVDDLISKCTNPALSYAWGNWYSRVNRAKT